MKIKKIAIKFTADKLGYDSIIALDWPLKHQFYNAQLSRDVSRREKSSKLSLLNTKVFALPKDQNDPKIKIF